MREDINGIFMPTYSHKRTIYKSCALRTRKYAGKPQRLEGGLSEIANSLTSLQKDSMVMEINNEEIRIRKLTPKECFRLMAFDDKDFDAAKNVGTSNTQLYKQAGNSICVNVLEAIFGQLIPGKEDEWKERWGQDPKSGDTK